MGQDGSPAAMGSTTTSPGLRKWIAANSPAVSAISMVEVLGYHKITEVERKHFESFFAAATVHPLSEAVLTRAIQLRQARKISLGDSLVAATALTLGCELSTHNTDDYKHVPGYSGRAA
jgi:predicted nucleic acid-binding protein